MADLMKEKLLLELYDLHIVHPRYYELCNKMDSLRRSQKSMLLFGDSGTGKTQLLKRYERRNKGYTVEDEKGREIDVKPVVYAEAPEPYTRMELWKTIVEALGAPIFAGKVINDVKRQALKLLSEQRVEMLILDEIDYILTSRAISNKEAMEALKSISNRTEIAIVLAGTPEASPLTQISFQYYRRFPPTKLERFETCDQHFCDLLSAIEDELSLPKPIGLGDTSSFIPQSLHKMSQGVLGALTPILQELLEEGEYEEVSNPLRFLDKLKMAQRMVIGDDLNAFIKMLNA